MDMKKTVIHIILQFIRFSFVSAVCFGLDYLMMVLMTEVGGINYLISSTISFSVATMINYFLSLKFVFDDSRRGLRAFVVFLILSVIGLGLNQALMAFFVEVVGWSYLVVKILAGAIVSFYNYITRKRIIEMGKGPAFLHLYSAREKELVAPKEEYMGEPLSEIKARNKEDSLLSSH